MVNRKLLGAKIIGIGLVPLTVYTGLVIAFESIKYGKISQLIPYVEMADQKPGISFEDQTDFARRIGISTNEIVEGRTINFYGLFDGVSLSQLDQALESYKTK